MFLRWIHKIETSSLCNRSCEYCPNSNLGYRKGNMTMETFERVLYWMELLNPTGQPFNEPWLHLHGIGEPLLNPNIVEMVAKANQICPTGFSTNGDFLTDEMVRGLVKANIAYLCISAHAVKVVEKAEVLLKNHGFTEGPAPGRWYIVQREFDDDWAGQVKRETAPCKYHCSHVEHGGAMILWDGRIVTCCVDAQANPTLGNVFDGDIRHINIKPIPLCTNCRNNFYFKWHIMRGYSPSLTYAEKEAKFNKWLESGANNEGHLV